MMSVTGRRLWRRALSGASASRLGFSTRMKGPTFRDNLPQVKGVPLTKLPIEDMDISRIIESMK